jgi:hypothetical protein
MSSTFSIFTNILLIPGLQEDISPISCIFHNFLWKTLHQLCTRFTKICSCLSRHGYVWLKLMYFLKKKNSFEFNYSFRSHSTTPIDVRTLFWDKEIQVILIFSVLEIIF